MWKVDEQQTTSDGKSSHCLWQGELKMDNSIYNVGLLSKQNVDLWFTHFLGDIWQLNDVFKVKRYAY